MQAIEEINFQAYLESVLNDKAYSDCRHFYTPTDGAIRPKLDLSVKRYQSTKTEEGQGRKTKEVLSVLDGLRKNQAEHVLLVGKPGSGKSTALEKLLLEEAEKAKSDSQVKIPVLLRLRQYQTSVLDLVRDFLMGHGFLEIDQLEKLLIEGRFLLLLDGVNELPSQTARTDLENFRVRYRKFTPMILTTRDLSLGGTVGVEHEQEMEPLTVPQMNEFVKGYLPDQHQQMLQQMGDRLRKLAETPLMLVMLCDVFYRNGSIPSNLGEAFRDFVHIYDTKLKANVQTNQNSQAVWSKLLQNLAFKMMQGSSSTEISLRITKQKTTELIQQQFNNSYDQASLWLEDLLKYHLIQLVNGHEIEFHHQLIQEYYAAENCINDPNCLIKYVTDLHWREVFLFATSLTRNAEDADRLVLNIKSYVDKFLSKDEKLQQFLSRIHEKSESVNASYKPAAIRAFYFELSGNFLIGLIGWKDNKLDKFNDLLYSLNLTEENFNLSRSIDTSIKKAFERIDELDNLINKLNKLNDLVQEHDEQRYNNFEYSTYSKNTEHIFDRNIKIIELEIDVLEKQYFSLENIIAPELHYDLLTSEAIQRSLVGSTFNFSGTLIRPQSDSIYDEHPAFPILEIKLELREAMEQLLDWMEDLIGQFKTLPERRSEEYKSWWEINGYEWLRKFLSIMQKHQNIGHNWNFSDNQKKLLRSYYAANQLLVDCLNSSSCISAEARQEIEDTLLLPISEIEKQGTSQRRTLPEAITSPQPIIYNDYRGSTIGNLAHNVQGDQNSI